MSRSELGSIPRRPNQTSGSPRTWDVYPPWLGGKRPKFIDGPANHDDRSREPRLCPPVPRWLARRRLLRPVVSGRSLSLFTRCSYRVYAELEDGLVKSLGTTVAPAHTVALPA